MLQESGNEEFVGAGGVAGDEERKELVLQAIEDLQDESGKSTLAEQKIRKCDVSWCKIDLGRIEGSNKAKKDACKIKYKSVEAMDNFCKGKLETCVDLGPLEKLSSSGEIAVYGHY